MQVPNEVLLIAWYVRADPKHFQDLSLIPAAHKLRNYLGAMNSYYRQIEADPADFPDVCMCGKIHALGNGNLRMFCVACSATWRQRQWSVSAELTHAIRAMHTICNCDPEYLKLVYAKAIWLESMRQANQANQAKGN